MLTTPHAAAGAAIAALIPNPIGALPLALASHYALDAIPHWQETLPPYTPTWKTWVRMPIDLALALAVTAMIAVWNPDSAVLVWACAFAANLPDLDCAVVLMPRLLRIPLIAKEWKWHARIQRETGKLYGVWPQLAVIDISLGIAIPW